LTSDCSNWSLSIVLHWLVWADFLIQIMYIWMNSIVMFRPATWIWFISFYSFKRGLPTANFKICSHHDIAEILLMLVLNTNQPTANCYEEVLKNQHTWMPNMCWWILTPQQTCLVSIQDNFKKCTEVLNLAISSAGKNYLAKHKSWSICLFGNL
jgi:hypothetical protein